MMVSTDFSYLCFLEVSLWQGVCDVEELKLNVHLPNIIRHNLKKIYFLGNPVVAYCTIFILQTY